MQVESISALESYKLSMVLEEVSSYRQAFASHFVGKCKDD